ncbi:MAG TPA: thioredoxin domain-containing protein [Gaiellaceae bacterium]|nr:thioredoxin domain-containing protein [Gaiellaceae bacterium]
MTRRTYVTVGALAGLIAAALIAASILGAQGPEPTQAHRVSGGDTEALLDGIPQQGGALGRPDAPVTLVEFADLQCPYCARWSQLAFGEIVHDYVRTGKVRIVFGGLSFIGPDSDEALRFAYAAGDQDKLWNVVHLLYANQGPENSGWVSDELLRGIGAEIPGFRTNRALDERTSPRVEQAIASAAVLAERHEVSGTPTFAAGRTGGMLAVLPVQSLDPEGVRPLLDQLLAR